MVAAGCGVILGAGFVFAPRQLPTVTTTTAVAAAGTTTFDGTVVSNRRGTFQVDDVELLAAQARQCRVHARQDAGSRPIGHARDAVAHLGGQHELLPPVGEVAANALLRQSVAPGRIDEVHARVEHPVEHPPSLGLADAIVVEMHGAEAQGCDAEARPAEGPRFHQAPGFA